MIEPFPSKVALPGGVPDRDGVKANKEVVKAAASHVGLRVGVNLCTLHVTALYELMCIPVPSYFGFAWVTSSNLWQILNFFERLI